MTSKERAVCYSISPEMIKWVKEYSALTGEKQSHIITKAILYLKETVENRHEVID